MQIEGAHYAKTYKSAARGDNGTPDRGEHRRLFFVRFVQTQDHELWQPLHSKKSTLQSVHVQKVLSARTR